jgi:predicted nuclease with TOPRIM domain
VAQILFRCTVVSFILFAGSFCLFSADYYDVFRNKEAETIDLVAKNTELVQNNVELSGKIVELGEKLIQLGREQNKAEQKIKELQKQIEDQTSNNTTKHEQLIKEHAVNEQLKKENASIRNRDTFSESQMKNFAVSEIRYMADAAGRIRQNSAGEITITKLKNYFSQRQREISASKSCPLLAPSSNEYRYLYN